MLPKIKGTHLPQVASSVPMIISKMRFVLTRSRVGGESGNNVNWAELFVEGDS